MMVLQGVFTYAPFMHSLFSSAPMGVLDWVKVLACGLAAYAIVELDKKRAPSDV